MSMRVDFELPAGRIAALDNVSALVGPAAGVALLVPGFTGSKEDFMPLLRPLAAAGYRAIAIDQRGQYESAWAGEQAGYHLDALAGEVCEIASFFEIPLHLLGHSFGGLVARAAMLARPALFDDLVLMGSGPAGIQGGRRRALEFGEAILTGQGQAALWKQLELVARASPDYVLPAPALQDFLRTRFLATDPNSLLMMGQTLRDEPDRTEQLAALDKPALVLHGADDDAWPPSVQAEMAGRLDAGYVVIERAAHSPAVENPAATAAALIEFWQSTQA